MSSSGERQVGKGHEKSNFALTCNLLSQFIKEKGIVVKPGLTNQTASVSATVGLLTNIPPTKQQDCVINLVDDDDDTSNNDKASTSKEATKPDRKAAQLTIFYEGKVLVFDDYPTDRARDLVSLAKKGSSKMSYGILANPFGEKGMMSTAKASPASSPREGLPPRPHTCCSSNKHVTVSPNTCNEKPRSSTAEPMATSTRAKEPASSSTDENASDLPIARRSSIYRFLEKRKDRAATRGPYHVQEQGTASASASTSTCDEQFDLNL